MSGDNEATEPTHATPHLPKPQIEVVKGNPSDDELAALITVLSRVGAQSSASRERNLWGHPVDKLRYPIFSWQRVTLLERTHLRRP